MTNLNAKYIFINGNFCSYKTKKKTFTYLILYKQAKATCVASSPQVAEDRFIERIFLILFEKEPKQ